MKADFSGYATKAGLKCSDGRTIMPDAFKHQDKMRVPLVWQHGHKDPENVLGHALLENRNDGVYCYAFFNNSPKAVHTKEAVDHKDINALSIWANQLIERPRGRVLHGMIKEVSLVLSGANPGAVIENVTLRHSDGEEETLEDEVIIHTGLEIELEHDDDDDDEKDQTIKEVYDTLNDDQKDLFSTMLAHATGDKGGDSEDETIQDVYDSMSDKQKDVLHYMLGQALDASGSGSMANSGMNNAGDGNNDDSATHGDKNKEGSKMTRNVFEKKDEVKDTVLSHDEMKAILDSGPRFHTLKEAFTDYAIAHGITDIDVLFPEAKALTDVPEWNKRRTEWVTDLLGSTRKSPFARIKTVTADLTLEEARAKGYVTGTLKKEQYVPVAKRITTPTTIYKKQALDRDDVIDITDFDVVAWLKGEMRLMLDEELGRAVLLGDGRDISSEDKINEQNIRPIATDNELYTTTVSVNVNDASSSMLEVLDQVLLNRFKLKGTGTPTFFTTEYWLARFLMVRETDSGRRMFRTLAELAMELRVDKIVPVEVMLEYPNIIGIMVNPIDYVIGADKGGQVAMFDDFDIDYNKQKYLIETRCSGALTKFKSAMVIMSTATANVLAVPAAPTFVPATGALTIVNTTGVVYKHGVTTVDAAGSPYTVDPGETWVIDATPASGYYFGTSDDDQWSFTADA